MNERHERKDAAAHRRLILRTAESLFSEHGVNAVSMHQIARKAGIGQGTLYRRYAHKGELCRELLEEFSERIRLQTIAYLHNAPEKIDPAERLAGIIGLWIDGFEEKAEFVIAIEAQQAKDCMSAKADAWFGSPMYRFMRDSLAHLLQEISESQPGCPIDPVLTAHAVICSMSPIGYFHLKRELGYTKEQMKEGYLRMYRLPTDSSDNAQ